MGHVSAPFGIQGWIKIHPYTETNTGLTNYTSWWLGKNGSFQSYEVLEARAQGTEVVARLKGFEDREGALTLRGMEVAVPRSELPKARRDEFYWEIRALIVDIGQAKTRNPSVVSATATKKPKYA